MLYFYNILAGPQGFEPWLTESKSVVLPLHYGPTVYYTDILQLNKLTVDSLVDMLY